MVDEKLDAWYCFAISQLSSANVEDKKLVTLDISTFFHSYWPVQQT